MQYVVFRNPIERFGTGLQGVSKELAEMYQMETKVLNQAVKRNIERFAELFRFQLTDDEKIELITNCDLKFRSQNATLEDERGKHRKYLHFGYTEHGIAMLSVVLRSDVDVKESRI